MYLRKEKVSSVLVILLLLAGVACSDDALTRADKTANEMIQSLVAAVKVKRELVKGGLLTDQEGKDLTKLLVDVRNAVWQFYDKAGTYKAIDSTAKQDLSKLFVDVTDSLQKLNEQGVLHIKNPDAKKKFQDIFTALNAAAVVLQSLLT